MTGVQTCALPISRKVFIFEGFCRGSVKFGVLFCICYERWAGYYQNTKQVYNSMHQVYPEAGMKEKIVPLAALESSQGLYKQKDWGIF